MFNKKITLILGSITTFLVMTVFVTGFLQSQEKNSDTNFLRLQNNSEQINEVLNAKQNTRPSVSVKETNAFPKINLNEVKAEEEKSQNSTQINIEEKERSNDIKEISEIEEIPYEKLEFYVDWLDPGESEITIKGENGQAEVIYQELYDNGDLVKTIVKSREIIQNPIREEIAIGAEKQEANIIEDKDMAQVDTSKNEILEENTTAPIENSKNDETVESEDSHPTIPPDHSNEIETTPNNPPITSDIAFASPGPTQSAFTNLSLISGLLKPNGLATYSNYTVNNDHTITVDGITFAYDSSYTSTLVTGYDGALLNSYMTASGLSTQRGIVASSFTEYGGLPFGTVLFVDGFGLVVVGDRNGMGHIVSTALDICFNNGELVDGSINPGKTSRQVYILSTN